MNNEDAFNFLNKNEFTSEKVHDVLRTARESLQNPKNEAEVLSALNNSFDCLKEIPVIELEEKLFNYFCPIADDTFYKKLKALESSRSVVLANSEISNCLKIMSWYGMGFEHLGELGEVYGEHSKSLLVSCGKLLHVSFRHCEMSEAVYGSNFDELGDILSDFFNKSCKLLDLFLKFLTGNFSLPDDCLEDQSLNEILILLSKCGMCLINLDVKTMAKVWKAYALLAQKYAMVLKCGNCILEAVNDLSSYITSNIESLFHQDVFDQDTHKLLKLSCFVLKLVVKFCEIFNDSLSSCQKSLFSLLLILCKCDFILKSKAKEQNSNLELVCQLTAGIDPLLLQLLSCEDLISECFSFNKSLSHTKDTSVYYALLVCLILKKLTNCHYNIRKLWFNKENNILSLLLQSVSCGECIFNSDAALPSILISGRQTIFTDIYEYILVTISAFAMTVTSSEFTLLEKVLVMSLLQPEPLQALLAIDIWCILARFETSEICFYQTEKLSNLLKKLSGETLRVEKCYLKSLILRLLPLLNENQKQIYMTTFPNTFYVGLFGSLEAFQVLDSTNWRELVDAYRFLKFPSIHSQSAVKNCKIDAITIQRIEKYVVDSWKFNLESLASCSKRERYFKSICDLTTSVFNKMRPESLFLVLSQLKKILSSQQPSSIKLYSSQILISASYAQIPRCEDQQNIISTIADIFHCLIASEDPIVKQKSLDIFYSFAHITVHEEVIPLTVRNSPALKLEITKFFQSKVIDESSFILNDYIRELSQSKYYHKCRRKIVEKSSVKQVIDRWLQDGKKIINFIEFNLLEGSEKEEIRSSTALIASQLS